MTKETSLKPINNIVFVLRNLALGGIPRVVTDLSGAWAEAYPEDAVHIVLLDDSKRHYDAPLGVTEHDLTWLLNDMPGKLVRAGNKLLPHLCTLLTMRRNTRALKRWALDLEAQSGAPVKMIVCGYGAFSSISPRRLPNTICVAHNLYAAMLHQRTGRLAGLNCRLLARNLKGVRTYGISTPIRDSLRRDIGVTVEDRILYNPVDVTRIRERAIEGSAIDLGGRYVLYLGRLSPEKNVDRIIRAFGSMCGPDRGPDGPVLAIAGTGPERERLERIAAEQSRPVRFLGAVKNPFPIISGATGMVLASDFEGMPTVLLEARALGLPIITTPAQGASEEAVEGYGAAQIVADGNSEVLSTALAGLFSTSHLSQPDELDQFSTRACINRYREILNVQ